MKNTKNTTFRTVRLVVPGHPVGTSPGIDYRAIGAQEMIRRVWDRHYGDTEFVGPVSIHMEFIDEMRRKRPRRDYDRRAAKVNPDHYLAPANRLAETVLAALDDVIDRDKITDISISRNIGMEAMSHIVFYGEVVIND